MRKDLKILSESIREISKEIDMTINEDYSLDYIGGLNMALSICVEKLNNHIFHETDSHEET